MNDTPFLEHRSRKDGKEVVENILGQDIIDSINNSLAEYGSKYLFDNVSIQELEDNTIVFDTILSQNGNWMNVELVINKSFFGNLSLEQANLKIEKASNTVCESVEDAVYHEIYHAKVAMYQQASIIQELDNQNGIDGISKTASKDMLETLFETAVRIKQGKEDLLPQEALEKFNTYIGDK